MKVLHVGVLLFVAAVSAQRKCTNVELSFQLTANTTRDDEFLSADSAETRAICSVEHVEKPGVVQDVDCIDVKQQRRLEHNWPTGQSRDFFFTMVDQLRGLVYVNDRSRGKIYVCTTTPTSTVQMPCTLVAKNRVQPKSLELMPTEQTGLAWIETAGRGVFVLGSTIHEDGLVEPKQILFGEYRAIAFDAKPVLNQDGSKTILLYAVAKNFSMYAMHLVRLGSDVNVAGDVVQIGKLRRPSNNTFFARRLSSVVTLGVYDTKVYYATTRNLYVTELERATSSSGFSLTKDVYTLTSKSPIEMHSVTFDGPRRNRPRITRIAIDCLDEMDTSNVACGVGTKAKKDCEAKNGICVPTTMVNGSLIEQCVCPIDHTMEGGFCRRWRTPYFILTTKTGIQRFEISTYSQDAFHGFPLTAKKADKALPPSKPDDGLFKIKDGLNDVTYAGNTKSAFIFQRFNKRIEHVTTEGEEKILLRNEQAVKDLQYEPRSGMLYWLDDARHMIMVMDPRSDKGYTRPIFWHKDLVSFHIDSQYSALIMVMVGPAFSYQNGYVRHNTLSFKRCNLRGTSCSRGASDVAIHEINGTIVSAYDIARHKLYVIRDTEFPSNQLTLTSISMKNWHEMPQTVRLTVEPELKEMTPPGQVPKFSVFNDRVYIVISPAISEDENGKSTRPFITMFAGALYRRTNPNGRRNSPKDVEGPLQLKMESTWSNQVVKFDVGYLYSEPLSTQLGRPANCSRSPCSEGEICVYRTCLCSPDAANDSKCRRPINIDIGVQSAVGNYSWTVPVKASDCVVSDFNCISALRRLCDGVKGNFPQNSQLPKDFDDEDAKRCILAGFNIKYLQEDPTFFVSPHCEIRQDQLCDNNTDCKDNIDESAAVCIALRKLPGICASPVPVRQCFLTPDSMPRSTRSWFFQGRTGGPPPQLYTDAPQCIVDYARPRKFRCVCPTWAQVSDDQTRCIPNNPCLDTRTNTDHCMPNGRCRYSEYSRRDFVCDCNPGYISPPGRSDVCIDPMTNMSMNNICYVRRDLCGQAKRVGRCIPGSSRDPTSFTCQCYGDYRISRNGMDCVRYRFRPGSKSRSTTTINPMVDGLERTGPCIDDALCGQTRGMGRCVSLSNDESKKLFRCECSEDYEATDDGHGCVPKVRNGMSNMEKIFMELEDSNLVSKASFSVAFKAFRPSIVSTEEANRYRSSETLKATPLMVADERDVIELNGKEQWSLLARNMPSVIIGVAHNRMLNLAYVLVAKSMGQLEIGAFGLNGKLVVDSSDGIQFFRTPFIGDPRDLSNPSSISLDALVQPNTLMYTTNYGRSLVACSNHITVSDDHKKMHNRTQSSQTKSPSPKPFGEMDCVTLIQDFAPVFKGIHLASRQRKLAFFDVPASYEYGVMNAPEVSETQLSDILSLEYSKENMVHFDRNFEKRKHSVRNHWTGVNAGQPSRQLVSAYDAINDRLTWIYGFENVPDNSPAMRHQLRFGAIVMAYDYNSEETFPRYFAEFVVPKQRNREIFSSRTRLSISNGVAALTLPDIEQLWMFVVPTEDNTRIIPVVYPVPKIVHAAFPSATPETYPEASECEQGVYISGIQDNFCVCPDSETGHKACTPLHVVSHNFIWAGYNHLLHHPATKVGIAIVIICILVAFIVASIAVICRMFGGVTRTLNNVRYYTSSLRGGSASDDFRPLHENEDASHPVDKKSQVVNPALFQNNQNGYVQFDRNNENVSLTNDY